MFKTILVPLDGSEEAEAILPHVERLAKFDKAKVILLEVEEPELLLGFDEVVDIPKYRQERNRMREEIETYLTSIQQELQKNDIITVILIDQGSVVSTIISTAENENVDLIAMAGHGISGINGTFNGSVAAGLLQCMNRPLLIVRSHQLH